MLSDFFKVILFISNGIKIGFVLFVRILKVIIFCSVFRDSSRRGLKYWEIIGFLAVDSGEVIMFFLDECSLDFRGY